MPTSGSSMCRPTPRPCASPLDRAYMRPFKPALGRYSARYIGQEIQHHPDDVASRTHDALKEIATMRHNSTFFPQADPGKPRAVATRRPCHLSQDTQFLWLVSQSVLSGKTHEFCGFSVCLNSQERDKIRWLVSCPLRVNLNAVVVQQCIAATRLPCNCQETGIVTHSGHRARVIFRVPSLLVFPCSLASSTARARSFCTQQRFHRLVLHDRTASYVCARSRHICSISFCRCVPTERDKYVWLVQSRNRPEKWTRTRKACSRGSATPDPVS